MTTSCSRFANARGASGVRPALCCPDLARESADGTTSQRDRRGSHDHGFEPVPGRGATYDALVDRLREHEPERRVRLLDIDVLLTLAHRLTCG